MSLPSVDVVRERIESVRREAIRNCFMATYLFAGRISEVIGKGTRKDTTTVRGPRGTDATQRIYELGPIKQSAVVFSVKTAKRNGKERLIGLPLNSDFEPWTQILYDYFKEWDNEIVFPFTRQKAWEYSKRAFEGLRYPIETYTIRGSRQRLKKVEEHSRPFRLHALRHLRATELVTHYGFNAFELATYCGWTYHTAVGMASIDRYLSLGWQSYFPKLLKKRR